MRSGFTTTVPYILPASTASAQSILWNNELFSKRDNGKLIEYAMHMFLVSRRNSKYYSPFTPPTPLRTTNPMNVDFVSLAL